LIAAEFRIPAGKQIKIPSKKALIRFNFCSANLFEK
jgi:hypothetical protein